MQALQRVLVHFFRTQPPFLLGEGLIELTRYNFEKDIAEARRGDSGGAPVRGLTHHSPNLSKCPVSCDWYPRLGRSHGTVAAHAHSTWCAML